MKYTSNIQLVLPDLGSTGNWGTSINYNFSLLDREITKIYAELASTKTLLGAGVPYYSELCIGAQLYKFISVTNDEYPSEYVFTFGTSVQKTTKDGQTIMILSGSTKSYYTYDHNDTDKPHISTLPIGTGAYVVSIPIDFAMTGSDSGFKYGDLMVFVQQVSSIYDVNYGNMVVKKYPETGFYIKPTVQLDNDDSDVIIKYEKCAYPDWVINVDNVAYSSVPAFHFRSGQLNSTTIIQTIKVPILASADKYGVLINFYTAEGTPIYMDYTYEKEKQNDTLKVTITPDRQIDGIFYNLYIGRSLPAKVDVE